MENNVWVYYSIYPGRIEFLETVVQEIVRDAVKKYAAANEVYRWFFIRYVDEQGPHIRLRFLTSLQYHEQINEGLEDLIDSRLPEIVSASLPKMKRLMPYEPPRDADYEVTFQQEIYEPEYEKYGGVKGVAIAEQLFEKSSQLALAYEMRGGEADRPDRFLLAMLLMLEAAKAADLNARETEALWNQVLHVWSGSNYPGGEKFKESLLQASIKRSLLVQNKMDALETDVVNNSYLGFYKEALKTAFSQVEQSKEIRLSRSQLLFHYIHMMNNRLGVWPMEEAYLGALLLEKGRRQLLLPKR